MKRLLYGACAPALLVMLGLGTAAAQQAHVNLDWNPQKNTQNLTPYGANVISPEVSDTGMVTFRLRAPNAQTVLLSSSTIAAGMGTGSGAKPWPFTKGADGLWSLTIGPVPPNLYVYKLVIDGVTVPDPNNTLTGFADQPGYSQLVVQGAGPAYYDAKNVPHGTLTRHVYHSTVTNGEREIYVYTPPGYDRTKKYPCSTSSAAAASWRRPGGSTAARRSSRTI